MQARSRHVEAATWPRLSPAADRASERRHAHLRLRPCTALRDDVRQMLKKEKARVEDEEPSTAAQLREMKASMDRDRKERRRERKRDDHNALKEKVNEVLLRQQIGGGPRPMIGGGVNLEELQARHGRKLLWGTANLFGHPRYLAGAATSPRPEVYAWGASQVRDALEATHRLGGANYVLWGGREGYDTILNTDLKIEQENFGRFLSLVVEHKHKIGFTGTILIEPKPHEPTKHQYDFDTQTVYGFLKRFGLEDEVRVNIEANHATLSGHTFEHEIAMAGALGIFGSIDANRGDPQNGWDTDQFPNSVEELTLACIEIERAGGFTTGGFNFDAKVRRQSVDAEDLFHGHIGGVDVIAKALLRAEALIRDGKLDAFRAERYAGWQGELGQAIKGASLAEIADMAVARDLAPKPVSGRQEWLENLLNRF